MKYELFDLIGCIWASGGLYLTIALLSQTTAEAESMKIRSAALSQNANLVQYEAVMHWDGKLPVYMTGSVPFINIGNK